MQKRKSGQPHKGWKAAAAKAKEKQAKIDRRVVHDSQRKVLDLMMDLYGDDADLIVNALHELSARVAISTGIEPETFAAGMKHHWDGIAKAIDEFSKSGLN
jgi:hypothetical protein